MRVKNFALILSIAINVILVTYIYLHGNHMTSVYSGLATNVQSNLVQLEHAIQYQMDNGWINENYVLEKLDDVRESNNALLLTGNNLGVISKSQEDDLWKLYRYLLTYPHYNGFPNHELTKQEIDQLVELKHKLNSAGWEMNKGYSGSWDSFSHKINLLVK